MPVSVHLALQFLLYGGEKAEKIHNDVKKFENPLTKYDMERISRLRESITDILTSIKSKLDPIPAKIMAQSEKEMGFLLSKINN